MSAFGKEATTRLQRCVRERLVGSYFIGSVALGGYVPGESDIDIVAVVADTPPMAERDEIAAALSHPNLECPTRGLEFVLYERDQVDRPSADAAFLINLNTGPRMAHHVSYDASQEPRFWFVIDRAIAHQRGLPIYGPPASEVFAPLPPAVVLESLSESLAWHRAHDALGFHSVLNACRAWRYAEEGVLTSKIEAAQWALSRWLDSAVIDAAVRRRTGAPAAIAEDQITALLEHVETVLMSSRC